MALASPLAAQVSTVYGRDNASIQLNTGSCLQSAVTVPTEGNLYFLAHAAPVPEPSAILLAALGVLALMSATRRRRSAAATVAAR